jgi:hypothetical protein
MADKKLSGGRASTVVPKAMKARHGAKQTVPVEKKARKKK